MGVASSVKSFSISIILLSVVVFVRMQEKKDKPPQCIGTLDLEMEFCCPIPPFFAREVARVCDIVTGVVEPNLGGTNTTALARLGLTCDKWTCILMQYRIYTQKDIQEEKVDEYRFYDHLDRWLKLNPDFKHELFKAKIVCKELLGPLMPLPICMFREHVRCLRHYLKLDCPRAIMLNTTKCKKQKKFYDECREFFF